MVQPGVQTITSLAINSGQFVEVVWTGSQWYITKVSPIGEGQSWIDETANRSGGTVYTNSTGRPIMVMIDLAISPSSTAGFYIAGTQFTQSGNGANSAVIRTVTTFIVPAGATYELTTVTGSLSLGQWSELR